MALNKRYYGAIETHQRMRANSRVGTLLVVFLLVTSVGTVNGASQVSERPLGETIEGIDATDEADEVYVSANGDTVLVYERPHETTALEGTVGVETDSGLAYALYDGTFEEAAGLTGNVTLQTDQESVASSGDLVVTESTSITDLDADVQVRQTDRESVSTVDVQATVTDREMPYSSVQTDGELELTGDSIVGSGTVRTHANNPAGMPATNESLEMTLSETDDGYVLAVDERRAVEDWERDRWNTRQDADKTLENRFSSVAIELGGTTNGNLESYHFTEAGERDVVEYEYDVEYIGVKEQVAETMVTQLQQRSEVDLGETEARVLADRIESTQLEDLSIVVDRHGPRTDVEWELEIGGYDELVLGTVEIAESIDAIDDGVVDRFDEIRATLETRERTNLRQTATWNASVEADGNRTTIDATWSTDSENWQAYTEELEDRGLESLIPETTATMDAETTADGLDVVYDYETTAEGALDRTLTELEGTTTGASDVVASTRELHELFRTAELTKAEMTIDNGTSELEAAAANPDGSFDALSIANDSELSVTAIYVESNDDSSTVSVVADGFVTGDPTETEVRNREQVGTETVVHMPGEWDREFPRIDTERVEAFLETELNGGDEDGDDEGTSGAFVLVLVGALIAVALVGFYGVRRISLGRVKNEAD